MKKLLCVFLCFVLFVSSALADTPAVRLTEDDPLYTCLYERGMELAGLFNEALHSEEYLALLQLPIELEGKLSLLQMQDFTQPWDVIIVRADDPFASCAPDSSFVLLDKADLPPALKSLGLLKIYESAGAALTASEGTETLVLSTSLTFSDAFIQPEEMDGPCFAVMLYGGLYAYLVTFCPTANGTVLVRAQFIPSRAADELNIPIE